MNLMESIGDKMDTLEIMTLDFKNMIEVVTPNGNEKSYESDFACSYEEFAELVTPVTKSEAVHTSRVVVPVRNGNATVVVPTDKEEKSNLVTKITALLPNSSDKKAVEKLNSHTVEELEVFYKQLQGKADALSDEGEFDLD